MVDLYIDFLFSQSGRKMVEFCQKPFNNSSQEVNKGLGVALYCYSFYFYVPNKNVPYSKNSQDLYNITLAICNEIYC